MRIAIGGILVVVVAAFGAGRAWAEDVYLADGSVHEGEVLEVLEDGIKVSFTPKSGGKATLKLPAARLDPDYFYNLRDKAAGDDAKARLRLALWAVEKGMFSRAKAQVKKAAVLDPELVKSIQEGKLPEIREGIATRVLASAEEDMKTGRLDVADQKLQALLARMPDTEAGARAREVMVALQELITADEAKKAEEAQALLAEEEKQAAGERAKRLETVDKGLLEGKKYMTEGLTEDSDTQALELLKRALQRGEDGLKDLDKLQKEHGDDAALMAEVTMRREKVTAAMIRIHVARVDIYIWRRSLVQARDEVKEARGLDPENADLASAEARIEDAQSDDDLGIHWQRGRRAAASAGSGSRFGGGGGGRGGGGRR